MEESEEEEHNHNSPFSSGYESKEEEEEDEDSSESYSDDPESDDDDNDNPNSTDDEEEDDPDDIRAKAKSLLLLSDVNHTYMQLSNRENLLSFDQQQQHEQEDPMIPDIADATLASTMLYGGEDLYNMENDDILLSDTFDWNGLFPKLNSTTNLLSDEYDNDDPNESNNNNHVDLSRSEEDDNLENELRELSAAETSLRMELEMASDGMFGGGYDDDNNCNDGDDSEEKNGTADTKKSGTEPTNSNSHTKAPMKEEQTQTNHSTANNETLKSEMEEKESLQSSTTNNNTNNNDPTMTLLAQQARAAGIHRHISDGKVFTAPMMRSSQNMSKNISQQLTDVISNNGSNSDAMTLTKEEEQHQIVSILRQKYTREYITPMPSSILTKLYIGLSDVPPPLFQEETKTTEHIKPIKPPPAAAIPIRTIAIRIRPDVLCGAVMDAVTHAVSFGGDIDHSIQFDGNGEIIKRQGGHLKVILPPYWSEYSHHVADHDKKKKEQQEEEQDGKKRYVKQCPGYVLDAQLCIKKRGKECERVLLLRVYPILNSDEDYDVVDVPNVPSKPKPVDSIVLPNHVLPVEGDGDGDGEGDDDYVDTDGLNTASQVVWQLMQQHKNQQLQTKKANKRGSSSHRGKQKATRTPQESASSSGGGYAKAFGSMLLSPVKLFTGGGGSSSNANNDDKLRSASIKKRGSSFVSPSVSNGGMFPAFSKEDAPVVESAWPCLYHIMLQVKTRELAYSTLAIKKFGTFPALSTLDVQYCTQLRIISREAMMTSLIQTAGELEQFSRGPESNHKLNLVDLLKETFDLYKLEMPVLPNIMPLSAYPLDYRPPDVLCPPWGQLVAEALNKITALSTKESNPSTTSSDGNEGAASISEENAPSPQQPQEESTNKRHQNEFENTREAVSMVLSAFQRQDDDEQAARLGRKNLQVMDRLAKVQAHKREMILVLRDLYGNNPQATAAADEFHSKALLAISQSSDSSTTMTYPQPLSCLDARFQVPLYQCGIVLDGMSGTVYMTEFELLFVTQLIPIFGAGTKCHLIPMDEMELVLDGENYDDAKKKSLLKLPPGLILIKKNGKKKDHNSTSKEKSEWFNFVPSIDAIRFKQFVEMVRSVHTEDPETLKFSARGGLLYMFDDAHGALCNDGGVDNGSI